MKDKLSSMKEITREDYEEYVKKHDTIEVNDGVGKWPIKIKIGEKINIENYQPKDFKLETVNIWSFPKRGDWTTHKRDYRGNWLPQMARNIILRYSGVDETVLDQMVGSGTTLVECKLLGRKGIGVDINEGCLMLTRDRLNFDYDSSTKQRTYLALLY